VSQAFTIPQRIHAWLLEHAEETIFRWIFRSAVLVAVCVLAIDLASINEMDHLSRPGGGTGGD
jgi:hypothetical protein